MRLRFPLTIDREATFAEVMRPARTVVVSPIKAQGDVQTLEEAVAIVQALSPEQGNEAKIDIRVGNYVINNPIQIPPFTVCRAKGRGTIDNVETSSGHQ